VDKFVLRATFAMNARTGLVRKLTVDRWWKRFMENDTRYSVIPKHDTHTLFHLLVHRLFTHTLG